MVLRLRPALLLVVLLAVARTAHASAGINVDFGTAFGTPPASYGAASGQAGSWNQVGLGVTALADVSGSPSGVSVSVSASTAGGSWLTPTDDDELLLNDNFFSTGGATWSADLSGLADGDYLVFLYAPSNTVVASGDMSVGGVPVASIPGDLGGSLIEGTSWASVEVSVSGGTLAISGVVGAGSSGLAGLQVVPVVPAAVNVDFGTTFGTPPASYGAASGQAGSWNQVGLGVTALADLSGSPSVLNLSLTALTATGNYLPPTDDHQLLLHDNFFSSDGATWIVSVSGVADGIYRVFVYAPSHPSVPSGSMFVGPVPVASIPGDTGGSLIEGTSWVSVDVPVSGGTLVISGAGASLSGLAGLQVVPLPEPGQIALLTSGAAGIALLARRRRGSARD